MFYMHDIGWGWEFLMGIGMVAFWVLIVVCVVWFVRGGSSGGGPSMGGPSGGGQADSAPPPAPAERPIDILDRRLASGELTLEEYRERREVIEHRRGAVGTPV